MKTSSSETASPAARRVRLVVTWLLRAALALVFLGAGISKLTGQPAMVEMFTVIGAGQWLRYLVGACEVAGAVGVLVPRLSALAAGCLALLMVGAAVANVAVLDASPALPLVLVLVAATTAWLSRRTRPAAARPRSGAVGAAA